MAFYILHFTFYILFAFLSWRRLHWAVLLIIATLPSYLIRFRMGPLPMTLLEGMLIIVFVAALFHRLKKVRSTVVATRNYKNILSETFNYPLRSSLTLPLGLFIVAATISLFVAPDLRAAAGIWKAYFIEPVLFFLVLLDIIIHHPKLLNRNQIIAALSVSALLLSLYAVYQRFTGFGIPPPWDTELRVTSIFPYPNALGLFLAPLVPLFLGQLLERIYGGSASGRPEAEPRDIQFSLIGYWILVIAAAIAATVFAKSTGALVGIIVGLFVMTVFHAFHKLSAWRNETRGMKQEVRKQYTLFHASCLVPLLTIILVFLIAWFSFPQLHDELLLRDWSGHVRRTQWSETWQMLQDRPILGAGLAGYQDTLKPYHKATYLEIFEYPHNILFNFWSETGLLGLLAFLWLVIVFYKNLLQQLHATRYTLHVTTIAAAMTTLLFHGLVDVPYFKNDLAILFWIIYALGLASTLKPAE